MKKTCNYKKLPIGTYLKTSVVYFDNYLHFEGNKKDIIELVSKNPFIFRSLASTEKTNFNVLWPEDYRWLEAVVAEPVIKTDLVLYSNLNYKSQRYLDLLK
jgi:hypothetical protein